MTRSNADAAWKVVLENFLKEAIEFSFPLLNETIDWKRGWDFLDKELQVITQDSFENKRFVDKLIRLYSIEGEENWLLIHIEIQATVDPHFSNRMFVYHYRSYDKFGRHPISCAILTDSSKNWRPEFYQYENAGCELLFKFPILKLIDLETRFDFLENSSSPFASILLIQLESLKAKKKLPHERYNIKMKQTKSLYKKGFSRVEIKKIFQFIDSLIRLEKNLEVQFKTELFEFEKVTHMPYITSIERMGIEQGLQQGLKQGLEQGMQEALKKVALRLFRKGQSLTMISDCTGLNEAELKSLIENEKEII